MPAGATAERESAPARARTRGCSTGAGSGACGVGVAATGVSLRALFTGARTPRFALGARETVLALGVGTGLSTRSDAETTSTRFAEVPGELHVRPTGLREILLEVTAQRRLLR